MPFRIGPLEIVIVLVIILIIFGVGRLPEVGAGLGKGIRSFKRSVTGQDEEKAEEKPAEKKGQA